MKTVDLIEKSKAEMEEVDRMWDEYDALKEERNILNRRICELNNRILTLLFDLAVKKIWTVLNIQLKVFSHENKR